MSPKLYGHCPSIYGNDSQPATVDLSSCSYAVRFACETPTHTYDAKPWSPNVLIEVSVEEAQLIATLLRQHAREQRVIWDSDSAKSESAAYPQEEQARRRYVAAAEKVQALADRLIPN